MDHLDSEGLKWIWNDSKNRFQAFLKSLDASQQSEVINSGTLDGVSVFSICPTVFVQSFDASLSRPDSCRMSEWWSATYQLLEAGNLSDQFLLDGGYLWQTRPSYGKLLCPRMQGE